MWLALVLLQVGGSHLRHGVGCSGVANSNVAIGDDGVVRAASVWLGINWELAVGGKTFHDVGTDWWFLADKFRKERERGVEDDRRRLQSS